MNKQEQTQEKKIGKVDFSDLILGFSSAALYYMGHQTIEGSSDDINLPLALQNIEIVEMLKSKSKGNLSTNESKLVDEVISDLRSKYVSSNDSADK